MSNFSHQLPESPERGLAAYSKQVKDIYNADEKNQREKEQFQLQKNESKRLQELEIKNQLQKDVERNNDRWFQAILLIAGAVIGALIVKLFDIFFK